MPVAGPLGKIEKIVYDALVARGITDNEARVYIKKLKNSGQWKGDADIELSSDGRLLAMSPALCLNGNKKGTAILVEWQGAQFWLPLSQVDTESEVRRKDDCGILVISRWIATEKGFIDDKGSIYPPKAGQTDYVRR